MHTLIGHIYRLAPAPHDLLSLWVDGAGLSGRLDSAGKSLRPAGPISAALLATAALKALPRDSALRKRIEVTCADTLAVKRARGMPWPPTGTQDAFASAYTTSRVVFDLADEVDRYLPRGAAKRAETGLLDWLADSRGWSNPMRFPTAFRAIVALDRRNVLDPVSRAYLGTHAQTLIHRFVSSHALGSRSQFDPTLLSLALVADARYSVNPLAQHEREKCLNIAFNDYETMVSICRSTITRAGDIATGCSAIDTLIEMLRCEPVAELLATQREQFAATLAWLEDRSTLLRAPSGRQVRVFQSDLYPDSLTYDAWFNALILLFFDEIQRFATRLGQEKLRREFGASIPETHLGFHQISCGGYSWPNLLKTRFLSRVAVDGMTGTESGNGIVLFGPPGTGKSTIAKLVATELPGWHFIELSTADFLVDGQSHLFRTIRKIFTDLRTMQKCVVFFDELELLVLERDREDADWVAGAVTNVMLPELQKLHDCPHIIPIFATNYISKFDRAGRRPGRFDYILPVGLPSTTERKSLLQTFLSPDAFFDGIEGICDGATVRELGDWAREYQNCGKLGHKPASDIWKAGFDRLRVDKTVLDVFERDIKRYAYPPGVA